MTIRKGYADLTLGQLHYRVAAAAGGTAAVFLHQTASSGAMWEQVMRRLDGTRPSYALDTPGFGGSFDPAGAPTMDDYAGWVIEALDVLGLESVHLVGHHTGAAIGVSLAARAPDRVASLALIGPSALPAAERASFAARLGAPFRPVRSGAYLLKTWEYLRVGGADADVMLLHREMVDTLRAWSARPHGYGAVWGQDAIPLYRAIACPMLLMAARDDIMFPYLEQVQALCPAARTVILGGGANFEPDLNPDEVTQALATFFAACGANDR